MSILQLPVLIGALTLEYLSTRKMAVARYLDFQKRVWGSTLFGPAPMSAYKLILVAGLVVSALLGLHGLLRLRNRRVTSSALRTLAVNAAALFFAFSPPARQLAAYHFFLMALGVALVCQYARLLYEATQARSKVTRRA